MIEPMRQRWNTEISDSDIAWCVQLYRSKAQLEWWGPLFRAAYPRSRVVLITDGDGEDYTAIARHFGFDLLEGGHLMALPTCDQYVRRMLTALLDGSEAYLFRIDPDARVWRRFNRMPAFSSVFGTLETFTEGGRSEIMVPANIQGGCFGLTRDA